MLNLIYNKAIKWLKRWLSIAKMSEYYVFGDYVSDGIFTTDTFLTPNAADFGQGVFGYKNLIINAGVAVTVQDPNGDEAPLNPLVIICTESATIAGHLHMDRKSSYKTGDNSMYLGQSEIAGTKYNSGGYDSVDPLTFRQIQGYAQSSSLRKLNVYHNGRGEVFNTSDGGRPGKGGMVALYYNELIVEDGGEVSANGGRDNNTKGGATIILMAPKIVIKNTGRITASGGDGTGAVATLNMVPEQVANDQITGNYSMFLSSIKSLQQIPTPPAGTSVYDGYLDGVRGNNLVINVTRPSGAVVPRVAVTYKAIISATEYTEFAAGNWKFVNYAFAPIRTVRSNFPPYTTNTYCFYLYAVVSSMTPAGVKTTLFTTQQIPMTQGNGVSVDLKNPPLYEWIHPAQAITLAAGHSLIIEYYITCDSNISVGQTASLFLGNYTTTITTSSGLFLNRKSTTTTYGPFISYVNSPNTSNAPAKGGAGLCVGVKLPKVT